MIFQTRPSFITDTHSSKTPCVRVVRINLAISLSSNSNIECVKPFFLGRPGDFRPFFFFPAAFPGHLPATSASKVCSLIAPLIGFVLSFFLPSNSAPNTSHTSGICDLFLPLPLPRWNFLSSVVIFFTFKISSTISLFARPFSFLLSISVTFFSWRNSGLLVSKWVTQLAFIPVKQ